MKQGRGVTGTIKSAIAILLLLIALPLHADRRVTVIPAPGAYANDQLLSIKNPPDTRLTVYLDGKRLEDTASPLLLYAEYGEQRSYRVQTELRSLEPESPLIESRVFEWIIDKKQPSPPKFVLFRDDAGVRVKIQSDEPADMHYSLYHPFYKAVSRGSVPDSETVGPGREPESSFFGNGRKRRIRRTTICCYKSGSRFLVKQADSGP